MNYDEYEDIYRLAAQLEENGTIEKGSGLQGLLEYLIKEMKNANHSREKQA